MAYARMYRIRNAVIAVLPNGERVRVERGSDLDELFEHPVLIRATPVHLYEATEDEPEGVLRLRVEYERGHPDYEGGTYWEEYSVATGDLIYEESEMDVRVTHVPGRSALGAFAGPRQRRDFIRFLESTLIPDLYESGYEATAEDFEECARLIRYGDTDEDFIAFLERTLIPDLMESGKLETANDFRRCVRFLRE